MNQLIEDKYLFKTKIFAIPRGECFSDIYMTDIISQLPEDDQKRILKYKRWEDRQNAMLASKVTRKLLSMYLEKPMNSLKICRDKFGRPKLINEINWQGDFNISHSGEWVICGMVGEGRIGLDIEKICPIDSELASHCLTEEEIIAFKKLRDQEKLSFFYEIWTLKEAFVKASGQGLSYPLTSFGFDMKSWKKGCILLKNKQGIRLQEWFFGLYSYNEVYRIALCSNQPLEIKSVEILAIEDIL